MYSWAWLNVCADNEAAAAYDSACADEFYSSMDTQQDSHQSGIPRVC